MWYGIFFVWYGMVWYIRDAVIWHIRDTDTDKSAFTKKKGCGGLVYKGCGQTDRQENLHLPK